MDTQLSLKGYQEARCFSRVQVSSTFGRDRNPDQDISILSPVRGDRRDTWSGREIGCTSYVRERERAAPQFSREILAFEWPRHDLSSLPTCWGTRAIPGRENSGPVRWRTRSEPVQESRNRELVVEEKTNNDHPVAQTSFCSFDRSALF